jgi:hypothetical protein
MSEQMDKTPRLSEIGQIAITVSDVGAALALTPTQFSL